MAIKFEITLQNVEKENDIYRVYPGDVLRGSALVYPDNDVNCRHLFVRLFWHTQGRGTRYQQTIDELDLFQDSLQGNMPRSFDFMFSLPYEPWSYEGHYVSVAWRIQVQVDVAWSSDPTYEIPLICRPVPPKVQEKPLWN